MIHVTIENLRTWRAVVAIDRIIREYSHRVDLVHFLLRLSQVSYSEIFILNTSNVQHKRTDSFPKLLNLSKTLKLGHNWGRLPVTQISSC